MARLSSKLKKRANKLTERLPAFWKGPSEEGVTQSMLSSYLLCKERFRVKTIEGYRPNKGFIHSMEYGNMWHACEEALAEGVPWKEALKKYAMQCAQDHPESRDEIERWYTICTIQFPLYIKHWKTHPDVKNREPVAQEEVFKEPYQLPSGRTVLLRGMWDSVDLVKGEGIFLQENKARGRVDEAKLKSELFFDLQTNLYLIALSLWKDKQSAQIKKQKLAGVRYNVIRRPFGDRKNSIVQKKGREINKKGPDGKDIVRSDGTKVKIRVGVETDQQFFKRLEKLIEDEANYFFLRWRVDITQDDLDRFAKLVLNPVLENLCDDYEWWEFCHESRTSPCDYETRQAKFPHHLSRHYIRPYGIYDPIYEGRNDDYNEYLQTGIPVGLVRVDSLFRELE